MRETGILLHISSLPSKYGIGTLGEEAYKFVDFLKTTNQQYWQVLPIGPTSYGDSPYQTFSAFAGNPYFIDLEILKNEGLLTEDDLKGIIITTDDFVDYEWLYKTRFIILKKAYKSFVQDKAFNKFIKENDFWIKDYALFMTIKYMMPEGNWKSWDERYHKRNSAEVLAVEKNNQSELLFWYFIQYMFFKQWNNLKEYANKNGIKLIGDMPIYVAYDSSDVWSDPKFWLLDEDLNPKAVAGVPPDSFSETGQLWGNPLYNFDLMKQDGYSWWIKRIKEAFKLFDVVRIDHFRGFESFYSIPYTDTTAINGKWIKGPGIELFHKIKDELGDLDIIAEDLGFLTEEVHQLLADSGFPGMKILQFAFDFDMKNNYLPHNYLKNCIAYTGTHDNMTLKQWVDSLNEKEYQYVCDYIKLSNNQNIIEKLIKVMIESCANRVIIPLADYLELGKEGRFNTPSTLGGNWTWRINSSQINEGLVEKINKFKK